ncbi:MAG: acyltransferase 3 [Bacteroidetes bacterium]|nr:MAG: acyltransferase 3 [Bacteroidota bacterium]
MESTERIYLSRLDHLRFLAAFLVLTWHFVHEQFVPTSYVPSFFPLSLLEEGHTGVALFMVLSGFIFQYINDGKEISYGKFIRNRLLRIAPLFILWSLYHIYVDNFDTVKSLVNGFLLLDPRQTPGVGWTIVVEFQFYLLFPFLHRWIDQKNGIRNVLLLLLVFFIFRGLAYAQTHTVQDVSYWTIFGRIDQFLLGMLAAKMYRRIKLNGGLSFVVTVGAMLGIMFVYHVFNQAGGFYQEAKGHSPSAFWLVMPAIEGVFYALLIIGYLSLPAVLFPKIIDRSLARCGELSYSAYWCHLPVIIFLHYLMREFQVTLTGFDTALLVSTLVAVPVVFGFSALTYYLIERPFLLMRKKYTL